MQVCKERIVYTQSEMKNVLKDYSKYKVVMILILKITHDYKTVKYIITCLRSIAKHNGYLRRSDDVLFQDSRDEAC